MRPSIYRPSKRFHRSCGEKIVLVIGLIFFVMVAIIAFLVYESTF